MRVALSEGRLSKWEQLRDELQPHQVRVLQAYARIEPWGEDRADMRAAFHNSMLMGAVSLTGVHVEPELIRNYIGDGTKQGSAVAHSESAMSPNAAAASMAQMYPGMCQ